MITSHENFFNYTLFNGYSASGDERGIGTFLDESRIVRDLGHMYDVIGGNMLDSFGNGDEETQTMIKKVIKIAWK